jgi:hypothetical protein
MRINVYGDGDKNKPQNDQSPYQTLGTNMVNNETIP